MHSKHGTLERYMGKSNPPSPIFCIHPVFFPGAATFYQFFTYHPKHILCIYKHVSVVGCGGRDILHKLFCIWLLFLNSIILEIFLYLFLQSCLILLKGCLIAACKSSAADSNAHPGLGATEGLSFKL